MMHWCFLVGVFLLLVRPQEFMPALQDSPVIQGALAVGLAFWASSEDRSFGLRLAKWAFAFIVSACISSGTNGWWGGGVEVMTKLLPAVGFFLLTIGSTKTEVQFRRFLWLVALACVVMVYEGWLQVTVGVGFTGTTPLEGRIRYLGTLNDPNDLGLLFCIALVGVGYLNHTAGGRAVKALTLAIGAAIIYGIFLTQSRGTMLAALAAAAFVGVRRYGVARVGLVAGIVLPILWGATRLATISADEESAEGRIDAWYEGFQMMREYPLFGVGVGGFGDHNPLTAHNSLVLVMAEGGLIGYTLWFMFFSRAAVLAVSSAHWDLKVPATGDVLMARTVVIIMLSVFVASMFLSRSYNPLLFIVAGLGAARAACEARSISGPPVPAPGAGISNGRLMFWAWASVPVMYLVTIVLLRLPS